ncbi:MAG: recombination mediator RecR [Marinifilaceae bacterium]
MSNNNSTKLLERAVDQFASLPGVGRKSALKFVLDMLKRSPEEVSRFTQTIEQLKREIRSCSVCHNITDSERCDICSDGTRERHIICVVENIKDIMSIEATSQYKGMYHVLGGIISPMEGIGPNDLNIKSLLERMEHEDIREIIFALSATIEGDTTAYFIYKKIKNKEQVTVSTIARGIAVGNELEYTDQLTLGRSILNRVRFEQ